MASAIASEPSNASSCPEEALEPLGADLGLGDRRGHLGRRHQAVTSRAAPPSMPTPMSSGAASGAYSPVIRPSYSVTIRSDSA